MQPPVASTVHARPRGFLTTAIGQMGAIWRPSLIPAAIALVVVVVAGVYAEHQNNVVFEQRIRTQVLDRISVIRARLEGNINGNIQLVRGLVSAVATEPDMDQERFSALAENLFSEDSQLRNVAGAPGLVVSLMHPLEGNQSAIGLDYRANAEQSAAVLRARDSGELVLAGPVRLVQGGRGFIGRFPVFIPNDDGERTFWGIVSAVIDAERLYSDSGLRDAEPGLSIAITSIEASGATTHFFGLPAVLEADPVTADVILPEAVWRISATPRGGWNLTPDNLWLLRLTVIVAGALVVLPILYAGRLIDQRSSHVRELRRREEELERLSQRLGIALETSKVGVWELNLDKGELFWDERMKELYFLPPDVDMQAAGLWQSRLHPDDRERAVGEFTAGVASEGRYVSDFRVLGPLGRVRNIRSIGAVYHDAGVRKVVGVNWDVSADVALNRALQDAKAETEAHNAELQATKIRIEHDALHDPLTGLPNRRYLDETLTRHARRPGRPIALLQIDLDRFKQINDTLGHATGDAMLVHAAGILKGNVRDVDFVARIGGDEFVVVALDTTHAALAALAARIIDDMRLPVVHEGHECRFGVSVGIAIEPEGTSDPKRLLINADIALYRAKSRGRNRYEFFTKALQAEVVNTKRIADEILSGLERGEFTAHYQPQFDSRTLDVVGVEALARWNHPTRGLVGPGDFLDVADELNVVAVIDRLILEQALADRARWEARGLVVPRISVNVSSRRLHDEGLIEGLRKLAIEPGRVAFELVESIYLDEGDELVAWNIEQIKELGIEIEIDDFGTGYASIISLLKLRPRRLKIDRQLVTPIVESHAQRHLVSSIIEIGRSLDIEVVAEGVETMDHADVLRTLGCDTLQGYAFARPMSGSALEAFLAGQSWRNAS